MTEPTYPLFVFDENGWMSYIATPPRIAVLEPNDVRWDAAYVAFDATGRRVRFRVEDHGRRETIEVAEIDSPDEPAFRRHLGAVPDASLPVRSALRAGEPLDVVLHLISAEPSDPAKHRMRRGLGTMSRVIRRARWTCAFGALLLGLERFLPWNWDHGNAAAPWFLWLGVYSLMGVPSHLRSWALGPRRREASGPSSRSRTVRAAELGYRAVPPGALVVAGVQSWVALSPFEWAVVLAVLVSALCNGALSLIVNEPLGHRYGDVAEAGADHQGHAERAEGVDDNGASLERLLLNLLTAANVDHSLLVRDDAEDGSPGFRVLPPRPEASQVYVMESDFREYGLGLGEGIWVEIWDENPNRAMRELELCIEAVLVRGFTERLRIASDGTVLSARATLSLSGGQSRKLSTRKLASLVWLTSRRSTFVRAPYGVGP